MTMPSVTIKEIQTLEKMAIGKIGIPSLVLMENAGRAVAQETKRSLRGKRNVAVVCGTGNNAGDGFVAARHLMNAGIKVKIFLAGPAAQLKKDAAVNYQVLRKIKYPINGCKGKKFSADIARADCVIDAIFGVGLNRTIEEPFHSVIEVINKNAKYIIAVDTPSGLDGTTGGIYGACIKADKTVTFTFSKTGFLKNNGPEQTGKIVIADIGIPHGCYQL